MASNGFLGAGPPMFTGENYHIWVIKMKAYLIALSLWEAIESEDDLLPLGPNQTVAQMKIYEMRSQGNQRLSHVFIQHFQI